MTEPNESVASECAVCGCDPDDNDDSLTDCPICGRALCDKCYGHTSNAVCRMCEKENRRGEPPVVTPQERINKALMALLDEVRFHVPPTPGMWSYPIRRVGADSVQYWEVTVRLTGEESIADDLRGIVPDKGAGI